MREDDDWQTRTQKRLVAPFTLFTLVVYSFYVVFSIITANYLELGRTTINVLLSISVLIMLYGYRKMSTDLFSAVVLITLFTIVIIPDIQTYGNFDFWTLSVVTTDALLVVHASDTVIDSVRYITLVYMIVKAVEEATRFGLYDIFPEHVYLEKPATTDTDVVVHRTFIRIMVFLCDFFLTRHFAKGMVAQTTKAISSVQLAEKVASALVKFNLEEAEELVDGEEGKECPELTEAFRRLLGNLHEYRPYLPSALFQLQNVEDSTYVEPGGKRGVVAWQEAPEGHVAVVFTDIQSSSSIWQSVPSGMQKALDLHNRVMRRVAAAHRGYEVKTIGDAFMIAFQSAQDAFDFCMEAQVALYEAEWPEELGEVPLCQFVEGAWNGLRVRMGIHFGEVDVVVNPITGRADYFGSTVNIASRVEAQADGGFTCVTEKALQMTKPPTFVKQLGEVELKGCGLHNVAVLLPDALVRRDGNKMGTAPTQDVRKRSRLSSRSQLRIDTVTTLSSLHSSVPVPDLTQVTGTAAHVRMHTLPHMHDIDAVVATLVESAVTTGASIACLYNTSLMLSWNTAKRCVNHQQCAVQYLSFLHRTCDFAFTIGLCTGTILHGTMGTRDHRYIANMGACVEIAGSLARGAGWLGTRCLATAVTSSCLMVKDPSLAPLCRPVDTWKHGDDGLLVLELNADKMLNRFWDNGEVEWGWSQEYHEAFLSRDVRLIRDRMDVYDSVLNVVCECLELNNHIGLAPIEVD